MIATILVNSDNQENYIIQCLNSCIKQRYKNLQIILAYNNLKNILLLKKKFKKKILFLKVKRTYLFNTQDQLDKIKKSLMYIKGKYVFMLDGDDFFYSNKVLKIIKKINNKQVLLQDNYYELINNKKKIPNQQKYKELNIYKYLINDWPRRICTSTQVVSAKILKKFFYETNPFKWKFLAIDIQLAIFCRNYFKIKYINLFFTVKNVIKNSVDESFRSLFNKYFWLRRKEQHELNNLYSKKIFKGIDYYMTSLIFFLIKFFLKNTIYLK
jgi:glycosyltransferase involved in cell wall biosynthesis